MFRAASRSIRWWFGAAIEVTSPCKLAASSSISSLELSPLTVKPFTIDISLFIQVFKSGGKRGGAMAD